MADTKAILERIAMRAWVIGNPDAAADEIIRLKTALQSPAVLNNDSTDTCLYCGASSIVNSRCTRCNATTENYSPNNAVPREVVEKIKFMANGCLVPPDGGSPCIEDYLKTSREILALLGGEEK